jgi:hypothetical protein
MSVIDEVAGLGHLGGQATMGMLTARWRGATRQVYVLAPPGGWDEESRLDLLHEFLSERLEDLTDTLIAVGADEEALLKRTSRIMKNWLIDQARKTDTGAIRLRLEELLRADPGFLQLPGHAQRWALAGVAGTVVSRDDEDSLVPADDGRTGRQAGPLARRGPSRSSGQWPRPHPNPERGACVRWPGRA